MRSTLTRQHRTGPQDNEEGSHMDADSQVRPEDILEVEAAVSDCAARLMEVLMPKAEVPADIRELALEVVRTELSMCASDIRDLFAESTWRDGVPHVSASYWTRGIAR